MRYNNLICQLIEAGRKDLSSSLIANLGHSDGMSLSTPNSIGSNRLIAMTISLEMELVHN